MPPLRFVLVRIFPDLSVVNSSLCSRPVRSVPANPLPISKPFVAGRLSIALARSASNLSNTGSPSPGFTPRTTHSMTPPTELPSLRICSMSAIIFSAATGSQVRTMFDSMISDFGFRMADSEAEMSRTLFTKARHWYLGIAFFRIFCAITPAATRPMVSRALERPPPATARMPYFAS